MKASTHVQVATFNKKRSQTRISDLRVWQAKKVNNRQERRHKKSSFWKAQDGIIYVLLLKYTYKEAFFMANTPFFLLLAVIDLVEMCGWSSLQIMEEATVVNIISKEK